MKKHICFILFLAGVLLFLTTILPFARVLEHQIIKPIPKSIIDKSSEHKDYIYEFPYYDKEAKIISYKKIKGTYWRLSYNIFGKDIQRVDGIFSSVEIIRNYRELALKKGGEILWEQGEGGRLTFTIPRSDGGTIWCHISARNGYYELDIVEKETASKNTSRAAREMKKELDLKGRITIYSILFDFDKYDLKKESIKPLREISELLLGYPRLRIEIQGHTDNQGDDDYNSRLSQKRAEAVKNYLIGLGIDASRLSAKGYSSSKPVAPNNTKEGRAKNRRVVLAER